jgi:hypothetical protein
VLADENSSQLHGDGVIESTAYGPKLSEIDNMEESVLHSERGGAPAQHSRGTRASHSSRLPQVRIVADNTTAP